MNPALEVIGVTSPMVYLNVVCVLVNQKQYENGPLLFLGERVLHRTDLYGMEGGALARKVTGAVHSLCRRTTEAVVAQN